MPAPKSAAKRALALRAEIRDADHRYYVLASPTISDREYDEKLAELQSLEQEHPDLDDPESPTHRVAGEPIEGFRTVAHSVPMLSIDNTYHPDDVRKWIDERIPRMLGTDDEDGGLFGGATTPVFACDPKIDGVALSLRYEGGRLVHALTRGDGEKGDDVTHNVRTIRAVPLSIEGKGVPRVLEVRGEAYIPNDEFARINAEREEAGEELFMNPRNTCAGTLKQLDPSITASRRLGFVAHGRGQIEPGGFASSYSELLDELRSLGFPISGTTRCESADEVLGAIEAFHARMGELPYMADGMVVRVDDFETQARLGSTSRSPRWCIAYKYPAERKTTTLEAIEAQVGKTGKITPRAVMEPVLLAGTTVRHATLHNWGQVLKKDIRVGDTVVVEKAGEIIPQVIEVVGEKRKKGARKTKAPEHCPVCESEIEIEEDAAGSETARRCINPECPAQIREKLIWFTGRGQMDIDGLGEKTIDQIRDESDIPLGHFADIFRLHDHRDALLELERMGQKKVENLLAGVEEAKSRSMARILGSLGIRHLGASNAKLLARRFETLDDLLKAATEDLEGVEGFGPIRAEVVHRYLHSEAGKSTFGALRGAGLAFDNPDYRAQDQEPDADSAFAGKTIVLTGTLENYDRPALKEILESLGAKVTSAVSKRTDLVIVGAEPGSKYEKARELGVETWDEARLLGELP